MKVIVSVIVSVMIYLLFFSLTTLQAKQPSATTIKNNTKELPTIHPQAGEWRQRYQAYGLVSARTESFLQMPYAIQVSKVLVSRGQSVQKGDIILRFRAPWLQREIRHYSDLHQSLKLLETQVRTMRAMRAGDIKTAKAGGEAQILQIQNEIKAKRAELKNQLTIHQRSKNLIRSHVITQQQFDNEAAKIASLQATIASMQQQIRQVQQNIKSLGAGLSHQVTPADLYDREQSLTQFNADEADAWEQLHADLDLLGNNLDKAAFNALLSTKKLKKIASSLSVLRAPFSGTVINRPPAEGVWVDQAKSLIELENISTVHLTVAIPSEQLTAWKTGKTVIQTGQQSITLTSLAGVPGLDADTGLKKLHFQAQNPNQQLQEGEWVQVLHTSPPQQVLWLPDNAVVSRDGKTWCIVATDSSDSNNNKPEHNKPDKNYQPQSIKTGSVIDGKVPVFSGLSTKQSVVTQGAYELLYSDLSKLIQFVD